jgi:GNAT superfamily N-acetyltransferase
MDSRPVEPAELIARTRDLHRLYRTCFALPPWSESAAQLDGFPARVLEQMSHAGAAGRIAEVDGQLAGVIYGRPAKADLTNSTSAFDRRLAALAPPNLANRLAAPALTVVELMVAPTHRRRGIATRLLTEYTADAPTAWLATHPEAPAATLYKRSGWRAELWFEFDHIPLVLYTWRPRIDGPVERE